MRWLLWVFSVSSSSLHAAKPAEMIPVNMKIRVFYFDFLFFGDTVFCLLVVLFFSGLFWFCGCVVLMCVVCCVLFLL